MNKNISQFSFFKPSRFLTLIITLIAITVLFLTVFTIRESRQDSLQLLVTQGRAFLESLTSAAENAIASESLIDYLVHRRFREIVIDLSQKELSSITNEELNSIALSHYLHAVYVYTADSSLVAGSVVRGRYLNPPEYIYDEVCNLIATPEENYLLILDQGETPDEVVHFYIEISNKMDRVIVLVADALYYVDAMEQTQIGYLAREMAQEEGVKYIIYQSADGLIFSTRKNNDILAIESDPFLKDALESDTIVYREYTFEGDNLLELVRPFSTANYPYGLMRIGLSLENYQIISNRYDWQMITVSSVTFVLVLIILLYAHSRQRRKQVTSEYMQYRSISDKIFEEMKTGLAAFDKSGELQLANDAFYTTSGMKQAELSGWTSVPFSQKIPINKIESEDDDTFEEELQNDAGESLLVIISKIKTEDGSFDGFIIVLSDITELKETERTTARQERLAEMGNLAAGVAHEIRNPLNTISIASQRLAAEFVPDQNKEEYLAFTGQIKNETKRLNEIITRFLALAREAKEQTQQVNLSQLLNQFVSFITPEAKELQIEIEDKIAGNVIIEGDADKLQQVLTNLYSNAKEALQGKPGSIRVTAAVDKDQTIITFEDSGPGIPPELHDKVLTPYFTTKEAGTGLGLPTVHKIISDIGGKLAIANSELGGAKIIISI